MFMTSSNNWSWLYEGPLWGEKYSSLSDSVGGSGRGRDKTVFVRWGDAWGGTSGVGGRGFEWRLEVELYLPTRSWAPYPASYVGVDGSGACEDG
jgi:hypothetical protein